MRMRVYARVRYRADVKITMCIDSCMHVYMCSLVFATADKYIILSLCLSLSLSLSPVFFKSDCCLGANC